MRSPGQLTLEGLSPEETARLVPHRPVYVTYRGSIAHGMYVAPAEPTGLDDVDIFAVYVPALAEYLGAGRAPARGHDCKIREWDCAAYEVRHLAHLLKMGNPNVLSALWTRQEHVLYSSQESDLLRERRHLFLSKRVYHSFGGYAHSQLKRMLSFKDVDDAGECGCSGEFHGEGCSLKDERGRGSGKRFATGFMGDKRKGLVQKFGYDCKNAAHLLRLLTMGAEVLRTGEVKVDRAAAGDAETLLQVKRGEWTLERVKTEAELGFEELRRARDVSHLPDHPDDRLVDELLMDILCVSLGTEVTMRKCAVDRRPYGPLPPTTVSR